MPLFNLHLIDNDYLMVIAQASKDYYAQLDFELTQEHFKLWIASLVEPMKSSFKKKELQNCKGVLNFQRFVLELNDMGMIEFMKQRLSPEYYKAWSET